MHITHLCCCIYTYEMIQGTGGGEREPGQGRGKRGMPSVKEQFLAHIDVQRFCELKHLLT